MQFKDFKEQWWWEQVFLATLRGGCSSDVAKERADLSVIYRRERLIAPIPIPSN